MGAGVDTDAEPVDQLSAPSRTITSQRGSSASSTWYRNRVPRQLLQGSVQAVMQSVITETPRASAPTSDPPSGAASSGLMATSNVASAPSIRVCACLSRVE